MRTGDTFDYFGETWIVVRLKRREVDMRRDDKDAFGKTIPAFRSFHISEINIMRKISQ